MGQERIAFTFDRLRETGGKALITYICAGDPDLSTTAEVIRAMAGSGADIVEVGVPFSDPLADGPVIQAAAQRALAGGVNLASILEMVAGLRYEVSIPVILMTYYNPLLAFGLDKFGRACAHAGVDGVIVPDLPVEEGQELYVVLAANGIALIPLVAPTSTRARIRQITAPATGFIYCVSVTGVTGMRAELAQGLADFVGEVRQLTDLPAAIGFGISTPDQAGKMAAIADGVIVGSALVDTMASFAGNKEEKLIAVKELVSSFKRAVSLGQGV